MEASKEDIMEKMKIQAKENLQRYNKMESDPAWQQNGKVKGDKPCIMYKMSIDSRVATKGVVSNVEGTLEELAELLDTEEFLYILDPQLKEVKNLQKIIVSPQQSIQVNYLRFKGIGPVSDRDFVLVERCYRQGDKFYLISSSCNYSCPQIKGVVRGNCIIGGYKGQKMDEKTFKVTYISDGDIKGSMPGFVKNIVSQGQGEVASKIDGCLKQLRAKKTK